MPKVLLIEDDATMLSLLCTLLEIECFSVAKFTPEMDILEQIRAEQPDVVVLDVNFQGMGGGGFDVLKALRGDPALQGTRVLMVSGMDYEREALEAGADDFLLKPFMPDVLIQRIRALV